MTHTTKLIPFSAADAKAGREIVWSGGTPIEARPIWEGKAVVVLESERGEYLADKASIFHPSILAAGHNPAGLDTWAVGEHEERRLLAADELKYLCEKFNSFSQGEVQFFDGVIWKDTDPQIYDRWQKFTYRTRKPPGYFLTKKEWRPMTEAEVRSLGPADFPPGTVVRHRDWPEACWSAVVKVTERSLLVGHDAPLDVRFYALNGWLRLLPGEKEWRECQ